MTKFGIGQPVPRTEDPRFLRGRGRYVADISRPNQAQAQILRSPHAHARIRSIDTVAAKAAPGVLAVLTGAEVKAAGLGGIPCLAGPPAFGGPPGFTVEQPILAQDKVRYVGEPVALIVAETVEAGQDAADLVAVDYEILPAAVATDAATQAGAPLVWDGAARNLCFTMERGNKAATDAAFAAAAHVTTLRLVNNRVSANSMESRASFGDYDTVSGRFTLYSSSQGPHRMRPILASRIFHLPELDFRVVCPDVGGGFGMKGGVYPEDALVLWAARHTGRPVKWVADRSEGLTSDNHGRDAISEASLALDAKGKFLAMRFTADWALGAYLTPSAIVPPGLGSLAFPNVYDLPAIHMVVRGVFSHTAPVGPYRGAGKPEAIYFTERLVDAAARELKLDPAELRRLNFISAKAIPYKTALMLTHDSGDFTAVMDRALAEADWAGFAARQEESRRHGRLRGRGLSYFMEIAAPFNERMEIRFDEAGTVTVLSGTHSHGQGHETVYAQMLASWLGIDFAAVRVIQGDTDRVGFGRGTYGSRSMTVGGSALKKAADVIVEKARAMAAHLLEVSTGDIQFADGTFTVVGTDKKMGLVDVARRSFAPVGWPAEFGIGLEAVGSFTPGPPNFPNGCHICEVEIDSDTGKVEIARFTAVDDSGVIINPLLFEGQIHGGIAMGIGQALLEKIEYDSSGQLLSGSFQDYCMPRADDMPFFHLDEMSFPCTSNPLGVKGAGESGTVGAPPAIINAVVDALQTFGVTDVEMPATPLRVWQLMQNGAVQ